MGTFVSWNCRGIRSKLQDIKEMLNFFNLLALHCKKPSCRPISLSNYVAIPVIERMLPLEAVAVQVHVLTLVTVCCVYLSPHDVVSQQDLDTLVDQLPTPFILLGDFNGHSTLWGSDITNSRGWHIERLISNSCLCLLNNDEKTFFHEPTRTFYSLDLAICSPTLLPLLHFTVGSDLCNSDHFPIIVSYADSGGAIQYPPRYLFHRADWGNFMQLADITESMVNTADSSPNVVSCYPTTENHVAFKRAKALAHRMRRCSQRESWINFIHCFIHHILYF
ncbi:hypothetical protein AVEN_240336-1 [Araneus ventricosus]|uniref:Endonuclease/exonuclease/phosphatase domain-containing protein n=1 Tax=Araneus ventricosus TaxID=182803 RepID=A0A4Y2F0S8_ARAVE|nr:hypothetical protein AVEN_240336-1 [Araneus ventricosus]